MSVDLAHRLAGRLEMAGVTAPASVVSALATYYDLLRKWNRTVNLTALRDEDEALDRLLVEPLVASGDLPGVGWLVDVGTGGGSPAIPLKLARPALALTMIEARSRKVAFLREAVRHLALRDAEVEGRRAEGWANAMAGLGRSPEVFSMRAVRPDATLTVLLARVADDRTRLWVFGAGDAQPHLTGWRPERERPLLPWQGSALWVYRPASCSTWNIPAGTP